MYYIVNDKQQVIAADQEFFDLLGIEDIVDIYSQNIKLDLAEELLSIEAPSIQQTYNAKQTSLKSIVGDLYIVSLSDSVDKDLSKDDTIQESLIDESVPFLAIEDDDTEVSDITLDSDEVLSLEDKDEDEFINFDFDKEIEKLDLQEDEDIELDDNQTSDDELFDLLLDTQDSDTELVSLDVEDAAQEIIEAEDSDVLVDLNQSDESIDDEEVSTIKLDVDTLSETIGISHADYVDFFNEYIDTALMLENDIKSADEDKKMSAIETLSNLSNVLHIPKVDDILMQLKDNNSEGVIKKLYATIARLSIDEESDIKQDEQKELFDLNLDVTQDNVEEETTKEVVEEPIQDKPLEEEQTTNKHKISLEGIEPIHFDFSMEQAANELSLPVDLIDEFVHDFIEQAHEETEKMLTAYDNGDLETVNKIGHLLKGTSSNLRITPLADTLYKIQFCESLDELEPLIKDYWGHFLAFEKQIKFIAN